MPVDPSQVSAVIVTRGNVDLGPILDSLIFDDVVVWDNSAEEHDAMTWGRTLALQRAQHPTVYSQDDDIVHTPENQRRILDEYRIGILTGCMWDEWSDGAKRQGIPDGYDDLVFAGSGSVYDAWVARNAANRYLDRWPLDDFFRLWADTIIGVLAPNRQLDIRFQELPWAVGDYRMADLPDGPALKAEAIRRAREIRDGKQDEHRVRCPACGRTGELLEVVQGCDRRICATPYETVTKTDAHSHYLAEFAAGHVREHRYL